MQPSNQPSSDDLSQKAKLSMNGLTDEQWNSRRRSGPLTPQELLTFLCKTGQLPPGEDLKRAS